MFLQHVPLVRAVEVILYLHFMATLQVFDASSQV